MLGVPAHREDDKPPDQGDVRHLREHTPDYIQAEVVGGCLLGGPRAVLPY